MEDRSPAWEDDAMLIRARHRFPAALFGNALLRIARGASGVLVGLYLADLAKYSTPGTLGTVGTGLR